MATLLQLYKAVRGLDTDDSGEDGVARLVRLADTEPEDESTQVLAAYKAWVRGDDETALRLAVRAQSPNGTAFPALLVLVAISAKGTDKGQTYSYAKQLVSATRNDKVANKLSKAFAGTGLLAPGSRREDLDHLNLTEETHDEWVSWSIEFMRAYEARDSDA